MATYPPSKIYLVLGVLVRETPKAVLIEVHSIEGETEDEIKNHWFPKTQIVDEKLSDDPASGELDRFNIKEWILQQNKLI